MICVSTDSAIGLPCLLAQSDLSAMTLVTLILYHRLRIVIALFPLGASGPWNIKDIDAAQMLPTSLILLPYIFFGLFCILSTVALYIELAI